MKAVFLQLTPRSLLLTPVHKAGRQNLYGAPAAFELPESLRGAGVAIAQSHSLAVFTATCMRGTDFEGSPLIICLDSAAAVIKEYRHLPAKPADLRRFAALQAETVLKDTPDHYYIATREYNHTELSSGRLKAVLFAVPKELVASLAREFRLAGLKVLRICPMLSGMMSSCRSLLEISPKNANYQKKTVAVIDAGYENLRVILFANGEPIFMKEFDSVWPDIVEMLHRDGGCSYEEALREMKRPGFLLSAGNASFGESVTSLVSTLLETASAEAVRNLRVVLSAERLEPQQLIFCGALAFHPDFDRYFEGLSLEIPYVNAEKASKTFQSMMGTEAQAAAQGSRGRDFFTLNGMLEPHGVIDFLEQEKERIGGRRINIAVVALLCAVAVGVMSIEPILYSHAWAQGKADENALSSPQITEIKGLASKKFQLENQYRAIENDEKLLPAQKSKLEEAVSNLQKQLAPQVKSITNLQVDGSTGTVTVTFTAADMGQFNSARDSVSGNGYFEVQVPFTITKAASDYQCSTTLHVKNYQPAAANSAVGTSSAAASSSKKGG